jgi:hypothetical protein
MFIMSKKPWQVFCWHHQNGFSQTFYCLRVSVFSSRNAQAIDLTLFMLLNATESIARPPPHLDARALPSIRTLETDGLRDAVLLIGAEIPA